MTPTDLMLYMIKGQGMIFFTDLDNTIIYSYKHDIGPDKIDVELYQDRNISFVTRKTHEMFAELQKKIMVIPISTRTVEQYERINLKAGSFEYALVCNGGVLLKDGERVDAWYRESLKAIEESKNALERALEILGKDSRRTFELRFIEKLFVFTKCDEPEQVVADLRQQLKDEPVDVFNNGTKVYVVPDELSKGRAVERFLKWIYGSEDGLIGNAAETSDDGEMTGMTIAAGDSEFDVTMLEAVDIGLVPYGFINKFGDRFSKGLGEGLIEMGEDMIFSDALLEKCLELVQS